MIKRRAEDAGLPSSTCCHTFRATGITAFLENGGTVENATGESRRTSRRERPNCMTAPATRSRSTKSSVFRYKNCDRVLIYAI